MGSLYVFAAEDDWLPVFETVESSSPIRYAAAGAFEVDRLTTFEHGADLPNRGHAMARAAVECPYYLASASSSPLHTREVAASDGITRFYVDQRDNPKTIEVCMGGQWEDGVLVSGRVATASDAARSVALSRRFARALRRHFVPIRAYLVGPAAHERLEAGWRLTSAVHSPPAYDLAPE